MKEKKKILSRIAERFIRDNPAGDLCYAIQEDVGIGWNQKGRYEIRLNRLLPEIENGGIAVLCGLVRCTEECQYTFYLNCKSPCDLYVNHKQCFHSHVDMPVMEDSRAIVSVCLQPGENQFLFLIEKNANGFGLDFGLSSPKAETFFIETPFEENSGKIGFLYAAADPQLRPDRVDLSGREIESPLYWKRWKHREDAAEMQAQAGYYFAWTRSKTQQILIGEASGPASFYIDEKHVLTVPKGSFTLHVPAETMLQVKTGHRINYKNGSFRCPIPIHGFNGSWLYRGPLNMEYEWKMVMSPHSVLEDRYINVESGEEVRPYLQYGRFYNSWRYPVGVTLYGLLALGRKLEDKQVLQYVSGHIENCVSTAGLLQYQGRKYNWPLFHQVLYSMDCLDDFGSMASVILEAAELTDRDACLRLASLFIDFIAQGLPKLPDGTFYRRHIGSFVDQTIWCDDLYMAVPFLIRYWKLTGKEEYLDIAARQFLLYKNYLFQPKRQIMSHVYDVKVNLDTGVAWGRGNGWCVFSLAELLEAMPQTHELYDRLAAFFRELAGGIIKLQAEDGRWHQVLDDMDSYLETSCTAMFGYGFCKGFQLGIIGREYLASAELAWKGITENAVDGEGNVYGVCRGSHYSFSKNYYKKELLSRDNDTHGVGIVLLFGSELIETLEKTQQNQKKARDE